MRVSRAGTSCGRTCKKKEIRLLYLERERERERERETEEKKKGGKKEKTQSAKSTKKQRFINTYKYTMTDVPFLTHP